MLDAFAIELHQKLFNLPTALLGFVIQRNADFAVGRAHGARVQAGEGSLDVEVADFAEVEDPLVVVRPLRHVPAEQVVRQVVEIGEADGVLRLVRAGDRHEVDVVDAVRAIAVDEIDVRPADRLDGGNVQLHRADIGEGGLRAALDRLRIGLGGVLHTKRHRIGALTVHAAKRRRLARRLHVQDEVDVALLVANDILRAMLRDRREAEALEQLAQRMRVGRGVFDELEAVSAKWIVEQVCHWSLRRLTEIYTARPGERSAPETG